MSGLIKLVLGGAALIVVLAAIKVGCSFELFPKPQNESAHPGFTGQCSIESLQASLLFVRQTIGGIVGNFVRVIEENDKIIVALSTIFIALFTIVLGVSTVNLWSVTKSAADAANLSAKAAVRIELPIIRAYSPELLDMQGPMPETGSYGGTVNDGMPLQFSAITSLTFQNAGRTPALLSSIKIGWSVTKTLPAEPNYLASEELFRGRIIKEDDEERIDTPTHTISLNEEQIQAIAAETDDLWFYVSLAYFDFMDDIHEARFCWRWGRPHGEGVYYFARTGDSPIKYIRHS